EIAELCYISTRGLPLKIVGIVSERRIENGFFGHHIYSMEDVNNIEYDAVLVSSIQSGIIETIKQSGIDPGRIYYL
ncbi:MAG: hypothetical protein M0Z70_13295, partial [Nitrospiraceae bacterium]|nr:hypothetical protein [Nitrospiraceae bacterium]